MSFLAPAPRRPSPPSRPGPALFATAPHLARLASPPVRVRKLLPSGLTSAAALSVRRVVSCSRLLLVGSHLPRHGQGRHRHATLAQALTPTHRTRTRTANQRTLHTHLHSPRPTLSPACLPLPQKPTRRETILHTHEQRNATLLTTTTTTTTWPHPHLLLRGQPSYPSSVAASHGQQPGDAEHTTASHHATYPHSQLAPTAHIPAETFPLGRTISCPRPPTRPSQTLTTNCLLRRP